MKIKEVDYSQYNFRRISINTHRGVVTFGLGDNGVDFLLEHYAEEELAEENGIRVNDEGLLVITLVPKASK